MLTAIAARKRNISDTFRYTGCLLGILVMAYYSPRISGYSIILYLKQPTRVLITVHWFLLFGEVWEFCYKTTTFSASVLECPLSNQKKGDIGPFCHQKFQVPSKWRNPFLYKLYGYGLCKGVFPHPK